jgi:KaiC/GvpD/RAD55 family RecA-like ATPase
MHMTPPAPWSNKRVRSGIPGFDELVGGGLLQSSVVLVGGDTGTGKTTFAQQFLYAGATKFGENGMYISFSQSKEDFNRSATEFGWNFGALEKQGSIVFDRYQPKDVLEIVREGGGSIRDVIESNKIRRLVIDPLSAYSMMFENEFKEQQEMLELFELLRVLGCTTIGVVDEQAALEGHPTSRAEFMSDGIVRLSNVHKRGVRVRAVEIVKMRYSPVRDKVCGMRIGKDGIAVHPNLAVFESAAH